MNLTAALDVAIGLVFMYLVFSLLCTSVNEAVASVTKLRARTLASEIRRILDDDDLRARFWNSGLILSLTREHAASTSGQADVTGWRAPSYISSATFARALVQISGVTGGAAGCGPVDESAFDKLSEKSVVKRVLRELRAEAGDDIAAFRDNIAAWFDQVMERTAGVYKRRLKLISFVVALAIAAAINADSIVVARSFWFDDTLRAQIAQSAFELVEQGGYADEMMEFSEIQEQLRPLPLGWDFASPGLSTDWYRSASGIIAKVVGLLLTAVAAMLGTPFWFDLLSRFVKIRSTGPVQDAGDSGGRRKAPRP